MKKRKYSLELSKVIDNIEKEARLLNSTYIGTEHLVLSILKADCLVEKELNKVGITYKEFKKVYIETIGEKKDIGKNFLFYTPLLESIIEEVQFDENEEGNQITIKEIFIAMLDSKEGVSIRVLNKILNKIDLNYYDLLDRISSINKDKDFIIKEKNQLYKEIKKFNCLTNMNHLVEKENTIITGFDNEIKGLLKVLLKIKKPNAVIVGEPGVGKTALIEKFAILINEGKVPDKFKDVIVLSLNISTAVSGTKYRGEFEEKLINVLNFVEKNNDKLIIFIDEFHTVIGAGGAEGAIDASNILKPALARGKIKCIGATTNNEFNQYIKKDSAFTRRFSKIEILEPSKSEIIEIMNGYKKKLESFYNVKLNKKIIGELYEKSKYKKGHFPDIALDEMEDYCIEIYMNNQNNNNLEEEKVVTKNEKVGNK